MSIIDKIINAKGMDSLLQGFIVDQAPSLMRGAMEQYLCELTPQLVMEYADKNISLWSQIPEEHRNQIIHYAPKVHDWSWFTADWLIDEASSINSAVASTYLSYPPASRWLKEQIADLKKHAGV